ncbi:uncharacterized protein LOC112649390 [Canis lupus dingo]|uniref:uncharacterized protein LOC112649390 n=1 Tax=Canis lupus dingo TaxID=286419 RepID=UPI0020C410B8|nr:uncharacterized protein LOC112649390 [Canis lupus dingo]
MTPSSKVWLGKLDRCVWQVAEIQAGSNPCHISTLPKILVPERGAQRHGTPGEERRRPARAGPRARGWPERLAPSDPVETNCALHSAATFPGTRDPPSTVWRFRPAGCICKGEASEKGGAGQWPGFLEACFKAAHFCKEGKEEETGSNLWRYTSSGSSSGAGIAADHHPQQVCTYPGTSTIPQLGCASSAFCL